MLQAEQLNSRKLFLYATETSASELYPTIAVDGRVQVKGGVDMVEDV